MMGSVMSY